MREGNFNPEQKKKEPAEEIKRKLAMYHKDVADHYDGITNLSPEDLRQAEREIEILEKQLKNSNE